MSQPPGAVRLLRKFPSREGKVPSMLPQKPACSFSDPPTPHACAEWVQLIQDLHYRCCQVKSPGANHNQA